MAREAEATFQRAIEINPREPKVFYNYASAGEEGRRGQSALGFGSLSGTRAGIRLLSALPRE
jgi:hypothetical protein